MRPCTGQRKLLPDIGSGCGNCPTLATWVLGGVTPPPPMTSLDAAIGAGSAGFGAGAACAAAGVAGADGAAIVVVFTTRTS